MPLMRRWTLPSPAKRFPQDLGHSFDACREQLLEGIRVQPEPDIGGVRKDLERFH
jgi:hypothetical protein